MMTETYLNVIETGADDNLRAAMSAHLGAHPVTGADIEVAGSDDGRGLAEGLYRLDRGAYVATSVDNETDAAVAEACEAAFAAACRG